MLPEKNQVIQFGNMGIVFSEVRFVILNLIATKNGKKVDT